MRAAWITAFIFAGGVPALADDISGTWVINGQASPTCNFAQTGDSLKGLCKGPSSSGTLTGTITGQNIQWTYDWVTNPPQRNRGSFEFTGTVDGNTMSGTMLSNGKSQSFTAKKQLHRVPGMQ